MGIGRHTCPLGIGQGNGGAGELRGRGTEEQGNGGRIPMRSPCPHVPMSPCPHVPMSPCPCPGPLISQCPMSNVQCPMPLSG
ncbi:MAG: hypothetical protein F6J93_36360 [Oscillatoria sp. SIO1A7]|nr:hypothetical protein [Oscillatoria sp. SIO1A7]